MPRMSKSVATKRVREAKIKIKKVYYDYNYPISAAQNQKILKCIADLDSLEAMFRKL